MFAAGGERQVGDFADMALELSKHLPLERIPEPDGGVAVAAGQDRSIR